ncbi:MAG: ExeM/NucH family extracellular endonuclease [Actinomycetaceae bacterium]|nr:ExeM/NucH family extracellular endonuclease [Actinomycetaceae bacterium]
MKITQLGGGIAAATIGALLLTPLTPLPSVAAPNGDNVVINEVYVRGDNGDGIYRDFVELYNPTSSDISLEGLSLQYYPQKGKVVKSQILSLEGEIKAGGLYLVAGASSSKPVPNSTETQDSNFSGYEPDETGKFSMAGGNGTIALVKGTDAVELSGNVAGNEQVVDAFGWGSPAIYEGEAQKSETSYGKSYQRTNGQDTDNNGADFTIAEATPENSKGTKPAPKPAPEPGTDPSTPTPDPNDPPAPATQVVTIEEIQGTGSESPLAGKTVTTQGEVTAVYPEGGFNGFYIQMNGRDPKASDGIFIYSSKLAKAVAKGDYVEVTGKVAEYVPLKDGAPTWPTTMTQIVGSNFKKIDRPAGEAKIEPVELDAAPTTEEELEALEGMLVMPSAPHVVADNYATNRYGQVGLTGGSEPLRQPSDVYNPTDNPAEIEALAAANANAIITLDDGRSYEYTRFDKNGHKTPVPYLNVKDPLRIGSTVTIKEPVILEYRYQWNYQPTEPVNVEGTVDNSDKWIDISNNERPDAPGDFSKAGANLTLTSFNVLNYFTDLGEDEEKCKSYKDQDGAGVTTNYCKVRGAYSKDAFERQEKKIVAAINELDSSIVGLEEIENSARFGHDRDESLKRLVEALNKEGGAGKWDYVPSPETVPAGEDVIRLAYIYQPAEVRPVGESSILMNDTWFTGVARQPLAQEWQAFDGKETVGEKFVTVVNHFKSKGSLSDKIDDDEDVYQGNNNQLRTKQAEELSAWVEKSFADKPVILLGDFNSYSKEDPIRLLENAGYTMVADRFKVTTPSYLFGARVGSLDHGLANELANKLVVGADVWDVNSSEPIAFEYSRYNYNVKYEQLFDETAFRSSDHNPLKIGLKTVEKTDDTKPDDPNEEKIVISDEKKIRIDSPERIWVKRVDVSTPVTVEDLLENGLRVVVVVPEDTPNGTMTVNLFKVVSQLTGKEIELKYGVDYTATIDTPYREGRTMLHIRGIGRYTGEVSVPLEIIEGEKPADPNDPSDDNKPGDPSDDNKPSDDTTAPSDNTKPSDNTTVKPTEKPTASQNKPAGKLPTTGTPAAVLGGIAALLLAGGSALVLYRRNGRLS